MERVNALVTHTLATPNAQIQQLRGGGKASVSQLGRDHPVSSAEQAPLTGWQP